MSLVVKVDGVALPDGALVIVGPNNTLPGGVQGLPLAAWYGEALTGGYVIDDPNGDFDFTGLHTITAEETAATRPFITGGWITGRRVERGPYKSGVGRIHHVDFIDINWNYALMVFRAISAKRPAETDIARFAFIQASAPMAFTPSIDNGRFNVTDNPVSFDDSDLVGRYPIEAINEFAGISGKNFYNYWDNDTEEISLHYDLVGVGPAASMSISNDLADVGVGVFFPYLDAELDQGPAWKVTGMLLGYRGAYAYGIRQATIDDLSPSIFSPSEFQRDEVYRTDRIGRLETAQAQIVTMLDDRAEDIETIKVTVELPAANVNDAYPGEILPVTFTHLPGYETEVELPVIRRNVVPKDGRTDTYLVHFELSGKGLPSGPGGGDPGDFPNQPCEVGLVQWKQDYDAIADPTVTLDTPPTPGNTLIVWLIGNPDPAPDMPGFTQIEDVVVTPQAVGNEPGAMFYRVVEPGDPSTYTNEINDNSWIIVAEFSGVGSLVDSDSVSEGIAPTEGVPFPVGTVTTANSALLVSLGGLGDNHPPGETLVPVDSTFLWWTETEPASGWWAGGWRTVNPGTYTEDYVVEGLASSTEGSAGIVAVFQMGTGGCCPDAGQWVEEETVVLSGADGVTRCPFADGSLHVFIDNVEQTSGLVAQDGETGEFTLGFDPTPTEVCTVSYQGR